MATWLCILLGVFALLYYVQILTGLLVMSDWQKYPERTIDELESYMCIPMYLYYILIFTDKLKSKKNEKKNVLTYTVDPLMKNGNFQLKKKN